MHYASSYDFLLWEKWYYKTKLENIAPVAKCISNFYSKYFFFFQICTKDLWYLSVIQYLVTDTYYSFKRKKYILCLFNYMKTYFKQFLIILLNNSGRSLAIYLCIFIHTGSRKLVCKKRFKSGFKWLHFLLYLLLLLLCLKKCVKICFLNFFAG